MIVHCKTNDICHLFHLSHLQYDQIVDALPEEAHFLSTARFVALALAVFRYSSGVRIESNTLRACLGYICRLCGLFVAKKTRFITQLILITLTFDSPCAFACM